MNETTCPNCNSQGLKTDFLYCPYCGSKLSSSGLCPQCGHQNETTAKFCQECGSPLSSKNSITRKPKEVPIVELEPVSINGITIEFGYSSSSSFDFAVKAAEVFPTLKIFGEGKKAIYRINFDSSQLVTTIELVKLIRGWKSSRIYVNGETATWDSIYSFIWCYERRCSSYKPELYCFGYENEFELNIWGCVQARLPFREHGNWVEWGQWLDRDCNWQFDKERIKHELQKELFQYRFCPAIQLNLIEDVLNAFPERVNPKRDDNWKFVENWGNDGLSSGLVITTKRFGVEEKVTMKGVAPNGKGALREIVKRMKFRLPAEVIK